MIPTDRNARHDHSTRIYESESELVAAVVAFLGQGLESNMQCLYVKSGDGQPRAIDALAEADVDVDAATDAGDLSVRSAEAAYVEDGAVDVDAMIDRWEAMIDRAVREGYEGLCVAAETAWLQEHDVDLDEWQEYERRVNRVFRERPGVSLCLYDRSRFSPELLSEMLRAHPKVADGSGPVSNPYYQLSADPSVDPSDSDLDAKLRTLSDHWETSPSMTDRERSLETLNRTVKQLVRPDAADSLRLSVETIRRSLSADVVDIWTYEEDTGRLESETDADFTVGDVPIGRALDETLWETFTDGRTQQVEWESGAGADDSLHGVVLPVGNHGVFLAANEYEWAVSDADLKLLETVAGIVESALDRRQYESALEDTQAELARQNERLARLERVNRVFQRLSDALVDATTTEAIQTAACEEVTSLKDVAFAWVGDVDGATSSVDTVHTAGEPAGYFDAIADDGELAGAEPSRRCADTHERRVVNNVRSDTPMDGWAREALKRDVQSVVSVPLLYDDEMYGVLTMYSSRANAFDEDARDVLRRISRLVARTMSGVERKRGLVGNRLTELELRLHSSDHAAIRLVSELECRFELEAVIPANDGSFHVFTSIDAAPDRVLEFGKKSPTIDDIHVVTEHEDEYLYECSITEGCFFEMVLEHNVVPRSFTAAEGTAHVTLILPEEKRVSDFMRLFEAKYPDAEIVAKRRRDADVRTHTGFRADVERSLSERQLESLKTAYYGGYFEWPRDSSTEDVADMLGVTHPTVSRHLREAQRKIFTRLFDDE
jgi:predicted DNA binding protein